MKTDIAVLDGLLPGLGMGPVRPCPGVIKSRRAIIGIDMYRLMLGKTSLRIEISINRSENQSTPLFGPGPAQTLPWHHKNGFPIPVRMAVKFGSGMKARAHP